MKTKAASWQSTLAGSAVAGGGTFALGQLINELLRQQQIQKDREHEMLPANALVIDMPKQGEELSPTFTAQATAFLTQTQERLKQANVIKDTAAMLVGAPAGFVATKALYDRWQKKQLENDISEANAKYMKVLQQASKTSSDNTPHVDTFCTSMAQQFEKTAFWSKLKTFVTSSKNKLTGAVKSHPKWSKGLGTTALAGYPITKAVDNWFPGKGKDGVLPDTRTAVEKWIADSWNVIAGGGALGVGGALIHAAKTKERKARPKIPSAVALNYQQSPQLEGYNQIN